MLDILTKSISDEKGIQIVGAEYEQHKKQAGIKVGRNYLDLLYKTQQSLDPTSVGYAIEQ